MSFEGSRATIIKNLSGNTAFVDTSGFIYAQLGGASLTVDISGDPVRLVQGSGMNGVFITNQSGTLFTPLDASGRIPTTNSGVVVYSQLTDDAGASMASVGGISDAVIGQAGLYANSVLMAYADTQNRYNRLRTTESGTAHSQGGVSLRLLTDTTQAGSNLRTAGIVAISDASGGAALSTSASCIHGIIINNTGGGVSGVLHIGSSGNPPWISGGLVLGVPETREFKIHNPVFIRVFARLSGTQVSWAGVDF